jgi:hypothetical protein
MSPAPRNQPSHDSPPAHLRQGQLNSTALRIAVGAHLRQLRETAGVSREAAGEHIRASHAKISRLENGRHSFKERDILDLLTLYGVRDQADRDLFLGLARDANVPGWWHHYSDVLPGWFQTFIGLEQAASQIRSYDNQFVPALLQTPEYARAALCRDLDLDRQVDVHLQRQQVFARPGRPLTLWAILDEAVLHRPVGGRRILHDQIRHLIALAQRPHIIIQVLPYSANIPAARTGAFSILRFPQPELADVVYLEQLTSALYLDKPQDLTQYRTTMDDLSVGAEPPAATTRLLTRLLGDI